MSIVSVCLPSDALLQHLLSYLGFSYLVHEVSLHSCSSKAQPLLLTLDEGYLLTAPLPDLQCGLYNSIANTSGEGGSFFLPPSDVCQNLLYPFYMLIKLHYSKALRDQTLSLALD